MLSERSNTLYQYWTNNFYFEQADRDQLAKMSENEIEEAFYTDLDFGTGGIRGIMGMGTNRMNVYLIRKIAQGLAEMICDLGAESMARGVAICYDSRRNSERFAMETALVLVKNGVKAYLFDELRPVPELSFAVRKKKAIAGVVITASHNPKEYNGFKLYWEDGAQLPPAEADKIIAKMQERVSWVIESATKEEALSSGLLEMMGEEIDDLYMGKIQEQLMNAQMVKARGDKLKIVYTPLHGAGRKSVERILAQSGFTEVHIVKEQAEPDIDFKTVKSPNPESEDAWTMAIALAKKVNADLILATDPDADRLGVYCKNSEGDYVGFTGNEVGVLLENYIIKQEKELGTLSTDATIVKSVVSTALAQKVANGLGVRVRDVPVGFKYIGEKIKEMEETGVGSFLFGFEESLGYLKGTYARDKDAILAAILVAEATLYYKEVMDMTLADVMEVIYTKFGYFIDNQVALTFEGKEGKAKIQEIMTILNEDRRNDIAGAVVKSHDFYKTGEKFVDGEMVKMDFPKVDMLGITFANDGFIRLRPSGTEPKIRFYFCIYGEDRVTAMENMENMKKDFFRPIAHLL